MKEKSLKITSVPKRKKCRKGSFPKCAGKNDMKMKEKSVKMISVQTRQNNRKGSFPKCAGEQPTKP